MIMMGKDSAIIKTMYDKTLMSYEKLLKSMTDKDMKIKASKLKLGIESQITKEEIRLMSLIRQTKKKCVDSILIQRFGSLNKREVKSLSIEEKQQCEANQLDFFGLKTSTNDKSEQSELEEDKETQDCSELISDLFSGSEFAHDMKEGKHYWELKTKSMKKNEMIIPLKSLHL